MRYRTITFTSKSLTHIAACDAVDALFNGWADGLGNLLEILTVTPCIAICDGKTIYTLNIVYTVLDERKVST